MALLWRVLGIVLLCVAIVLTPERVELAGAQAVGALDRSSVAQHHHDTAAKAGDHHRTALDAACAKWCAMQCGSMQDAPCLRVTERRESHRLILAAAEDRLVAGLNPNPVVPPPKQLT